MREAKTGTSLFTLTDMNKTKAQMQVELEEALKSNSSFIEKLREQQEELDAQQERVNELVRTSDELAASLKTTAEESEKRRQKIADMQTALDSLTQKHNDLLKSQGSTALIAKLAMDLGSWDWPVNTIGLLPMDSAKLRSQVAALKKAVKDSQASTTATQSSPRA